jgi:ketosteroid isomerase-like protein
MAPQSREQWLEDLTVGFVGQNYKEWHASIQHYWEDVDNKSAIVWCTENGLLVDGSEYKMDYIMRYEFDESGRLEKLFEYTDSDLQKQIARKWVERLEKEKREKIN